MLLELLCRRAISWNQAGSMTRLLNCSRVAMGWGTTNSSNTLAETCSRLSINAASYHQLHARTPSATAQMGATNQCGASPLLGHYMNEVALQQPCRGKARGNEYQPSNRKRKSKHGFHKRMRSRGGIEVIWRRLIKGRRLLTH